ncbi:unnamed protein product [Paramecium octaurelia]|uniref:Dolichyl-diphosphooligosaccharide--protein glycosyltransferase subunit 1 n=1 Tax=Paramecium octaurelia TaxID=43137 RepID=A0A8S1RXF7_PAROT|nr:unnamed protein product [Paramecium octaurelia]
MLLLIFLALASSLRIQKNFAISNIERTVSLTDRYVNIQSKITFQNDGVIPIEKIYYTIHNVLSDRLYHVNIEECNAKKLIEDVDVKYKQNATVYEFTLIKPIEPSSTLEVELSEQFYKRFNPLPKEIGLEDEQLVQFKDSVYFFTPYPVKNQITYYDTPKIISYSLKSAIQRNQLLEFGPFQDVKPYTTQIHTIHLENNTPMTIFTKASKIVEVSHWGNILIEENYSIENQGAKLKGEFGRVSFNKYNPNVGKHSLKQLSASLPYDSWGVYYRDEIGNISTSNAAKGKLNGENQALVQLRPRFAIFGGWRSNFTLGYNLPTKKYLEQDGNNFRLTLNFSFSVKEIVSDKYTFQISLPEGAYDIQVDLPLQVERNDTLLFSYFDTVGRPTIILNKATTSQFDNKQIIITYRLSGASILREPLMIFGSFLFAFLSIIYLRRLDLQTLKLKE